MSKFQLILTGVFGGFILIGVLVFAFYKGNSTPPAKVVVWGTMPQEVFSRVLVGSSLSQSETVSVQYVEKNPNTFDTDFVNALASGVGPDVIFLPHDHILKNRNRVFTVPFESYSERDFKNTFAEGGEVFLTSQGILAFPVTIDPLVMYWNRDIFTNANFASPPGFWDQFYILSEALTKKDGALNVSQAAVALGEYTNVRNSKEILAALILQAGNPIVTVSETNARSTLADSFDMPVAPSVAALTFYTEFSNPAKPFYSWNRSLPDSQSFFVSNDLAVYLGFGSELSSIRLKNPNLNFDVAPLPQVRTVEKKLTYGKMNALAIVRNSKNIGAAFSVVSQLTTREVQASFSKEFGIPPARRDLLSARQSGSSEYVFYSSALFSKAWFDPDRDRTNDMFSEMITNITGGKARLDTALSRAHQILQSLLR